MWQEGVWAKRVKPGKVPADAFGLCLDGEVMLYYPDAIPDKARGSCWWVRDEPFTRKLAPMPQQPEAGISIVLAPYLMDQSRPEAALAHWLAGQGEVIMHSDVDSLLQQEWHWPAYLQADEWVALKKTMNQRLCNTAGLRCIRLEPLDLYPGISCAKQMLANATAKPDQTANPSTNKPTNKPANPTNGSSSDSSGAPHTGPDQRRPLYGLRTWMDKLRGESTGVGRKQWLAADAFLQVQARKQLPQLARQLQACPQPPEPYRKDVQIACLTQLAHLAAVGRHWPTLAGRFADNPPSERQLALLVAESRRVGQELEQCQILLADTKQVPDVVSLLAHIEALAGALKRRRTAWWEVQ